MAFDEGLAQRIREEIGDLPGMVEKKMFGGVGFILQGNMACGVHKDLLIVRLRSGRLRPDSQKGAYPGFRYDRTCHARLDFG